MQPVAWADFEMDAGASEAAAPGAPLLRPDLCDVHRSVNERIAVAGRRPSHNGTSSDGDIFALFNAANAKLIVAAGLLLVSVYHCVLHLTSLRQDTCVGLLETGRYQGEHIWQPYGCMLHRYSQADSRMCVKKRRTEHGLGNWVVFVGDARTFQLFEKLVQQFSPESSFKYGEPGAPDLSLYNKLGMKSHRFVEQSIGLHIDFVEALHADEQLEFLMDSFLANRATNGTPSLIVIGFSLEFLNETMRYGVLEQDIDLHLEYYETNLSRLVEPIRGLRQSKTMTLWMSQSAIDERFFYPKVVSTKRSVNTSGIENESSLSSTVTSDTVIDPTMANWALSLYNEVADKQLGTSGAVRMWRSAALLGNGYMRDSVDGGLTYGHVALDYVCFFESSYEHFGAAHMQILLNMYCNGRVRHADGTCCNAPEKFTPLQITAFATYLLIIFAAVCIWSIRVDFSRCRPFAPANNERTDRRGSNAVQLLYTLARLSAIMVYFYTCDRADFFLKENKWFTYFNLFLPVVYLTVLGVFFMEGTDDVQFLSREQSAEWKGWMQLFMLSSQLTGASEIQWVYMLNRAFIASYLFLLGYGHFMYFWKTGDYGLVLVRYNLVVALLCISMNRPYQFYYYVPLVSFWFLVVYVTMACPPQVGANSRNDGVAHFVMTTKLVVLFSVISVLYLSQIFFERLTVAGPWRPLLTISGGARAWWTKWWRHRYAAPAGMVFAFVVSLLRHKKLLVDDKGGPLFSNNRITYASVAVASLGIFTYLVLITHFCANVRDCDERHAYVVFVPIVSYLVLRNVVGWVRARASSLFAWFGMINLELMTAQHHVWMVADSAGVLVLLPRYPVFNVLVTSVVFVCVAHELRVCCKRLVPVLVPESGAGGGGGRSAPLRSVFAALLAATLLAMCIAFYTREGGDDDDAFA